MSGYPYLWAGIGNLLKLSALLGFLASAFFFVLSVERYRANAVDDRFTVLAVSTVGSFLYAALLWNIKPMLVSGRPRLVRWLVGAYMVWWVISTLGIGTFFIAIAYATARAPADWDGPSRRSSRRSPKEVRMPRPRNWSPTAHVGLSGTNLYSDIHRSDLVGELDFNVPVQVLDRQAGLAYVIAPSGMRGWMDTRTLVETA